MGVQHSLNHSAVPENSTAEDYEPEILQILVGLRCWYMPFIIFLGIFGNCLALLTIFATKLRDCSPNHYLAVLTASDTVFLISLIPVWRGVYSNRGICQVFTYLLNVSSWISSWSTTALTVERFFAIFYPLSMLTYCDVKTARRVILGILPFPLLFNVWVFLSHDVRSGVCTVVSHFDASFLLSILDSILIFGAPSIVLTLLNGAIVTKLLKDRIYEAQREQDHCSVRSEALPLNRASKKRPMRTTRHYKQGDTHVRKITGLLLIVPSIFLILNFPYYAIRFRNYVMSSISDSPPPTIADLVANQVAAMLYFTNYAIDFYLYAFSSDNFRQATLSLFRRFVSAKLRSDFQATVLTISGSSSRRSRSSGKFKTTGTRKDGRNINEYQCGSKEYLEMKNVPTTENGK